MLTLSLNLQRLESFVGDSDMDIEECLLILSNLQRLESFVSASDVDIEEFLLFL